MIWGSFCFLVAGPLSSSGSGSQEMPGRDLLMRLNSFLPSCLCCQPRGSLSAEISSFPLGNPKDGSHASHIRPAVGGSLPSDWEVAREKITTTVRTSFLQLKPVSPPSDRLLQVGAMSPTSGGGLLGVGHVSRAPLCFLGTLLPSCVQDGSCPRGGLSPSRGI